MGPRMTSSRFWIVQGITAVRIPLAIAFGLFVIYGPATTGQLVLLLVLLFLVELSDFIDGRLARRFGVGSPYGDLLDPYADSTSRLVIFFSLAYVGRALWLLPLVMALRDILVAYSRIAMVSAGSSVAAKWPGKIKAGFQSGGAFFLTALILVPEEFREPLIIASSLLVMAVTAWSGIAYVRGALESFGRRSD